MIGRAGPEDFPHLTALWQACFGDSPETIAAFWQTFGKTVQVFCAWKKREPISMVCALPVQLIDAAGENHRAAYLYAVATDPSCRGRGLCGKVLAFAEDSLRKSGVSFTLLVPSEPSLFSLYRRYGYQTISHRGCEMIFFTPCEGAVQEIEPEAYCNLRELLLYDSFVSFAPDFLRYQALDDRLYRVETAQQVFCAVCSEANGRLTVKELLPYDSSAAALLLHTSGMRQGICRTPGGSQPYAMGKALRGGALPENVYFGLAMD